MTGAELDEVIPLLRQYHYLGHKDVATPRYVFAWREPGGLLGDTGTPVAAAIFASPANRYFTNAIDMTRLVRKPELDLQLSQFVAWCLRWIKRNSDIGLCISYADSSLHHGGIYQALSFIYVGLTTGHSLWINPYTGQVAANRSFDQRRPEYRKEWQRIKSPPKYLYIRALNERPHEMMRRFGWKPLPYPKPEARSA